jgi:hypothetical protein
MEKEKICWWRTSQLEETLLGKSQITPDKSEVYKQRSAGVISFLLCLLLLPLLVPPHLIQSGITSLLGSGGLCPRAGHLHVITNVINKSQIKNLYVFRKLRSVRPIP